MSSHLFTSESVSEGHPDKVADQISDAVLDAILAQDKHAHVACETLVKTGVAIVAGEITTNAWVDIEAEVARLEKLGAAIDKRFERWVVMRAPSGQRFCVVRVQRPGFAENANRWD